MFVVGATRADQIASIRALAPEHFFLVPGIGAQGGDLDLVMKHGMNKQCGLLINSSARYHLCLGWKRFCKKGGRRGEESSARDEQVFLVKWNF
jgi:orotidine-5'-phosphate decarboxylase